MSPGIPPEDWAQVEDPDDEPEPVPVVPGQVGMDGSSVPEGVGTRAAEVDQEEVWALLSQQMSLLTSVIERLTGVLERQQASPTQNWQTNSPPDQGQYQAGQPIQGQPQGQGEPSPGWLCPVHGQRKIVPAGYSQRTQKPYPAFAACPVQGCSQKPPRN